MSSTFPEILVHSTLPHNGAGEALPLKNYLRGLCFRSSDNRLNIQRHLRWTGARQRRALGQRHKLFEDCRP